jgi:hypothetical protein
MIEINVAKSIGVETPPETKAPRDTTTIEVIFFRHMHYICLLNTHANVLAHRSRNGK